jgi:hypothetical protein
VGTIGYDILFASKRSSGHVFNGFKQKALGNFSKESFEKLASGTQQIDATD